MCFAQEIREEKNHLLSSWFPVSAAARIVTLGSQGCDRGIECVEILCIDDVLPESECETIRTSRQFEYVLK